MKILVLAPHVDDAEFGCGATISRFVSEGHDVNVWVFSVSEHTLKEGDTRSTRILELENSMRILGVKYYWCDNNPAIHRNMDKYRSGILDRMVELRKIMDRDTVFIPACNDIHQDHSVIREEAIRAFKHCSLYGYEMPWNNMESKHSMFVRVSAKDLENKVKAIECYESVGTVAYKSRRFIEGLAIVRGVQAGCLYAESFEVIRKII